MPNQFEKVVAAILRLVYVELMSEIFRLEAHGVKITPIKISECYRVAVSRAVDIYTETQKQQKPQVDAVIAFAMTMQAHEQAKKAQSVNDLIEKALKKESEG